MKLGVIIIATGKPLYGRLAFALACSIKNNSSIPVCIIHDNIALKDLSDRQRGLFDQEIVVIPAKGLTDSENAFRLKTELYHLTPFEKTILLDADNIILPGKKVDDWFTEHEGKKFTASCNGFYDYSSGAHTRTDYPYWADPEETKKHFGISDNAKLPQVNTSFVYFEKCHEVEELFRIAKNVWDDNTFISGTYRNSKTDEFCFNVACALTGIYPHQFPYRPIFFFFQSENLHESYILDNYLAISVICDQPDERIIDLYNKYMVYYFNKFGFKEYFYYSDKTEKTSRPVKGFWHIAQMNQWRDIVKEQLMILVHDGLYEKCSEIIVSVAGDGDIRELFAKYPKIKIQSASQLSEYEFPALRLIKSYSMSSKFFGFYFHTKGVSLLAPNQDKSHKDNWRDLLNHYVLRCWKKCYNKVSGNYDVAGANWLQENSAYPSHFSGNFYWFDSEYIKRLPEIHNLNRKNRYDAEMWLGKKNPKVYCIASHTMDGYTSEWFPKRKIGIFWRVGEDFQGKMNLLQNSGLLAEAHHSVAFTDKHDPVGFTAISNGQYWEHLKSYCDLNPDAFICFPDDTDAIFDWKKHFQTLEKGYDSVGKEGVMWATAGFINSLKSLEDLNNTKRKYIA